MEEMRLGMVLMELPERRKVCKSFSWHTHVGNVSKLLSSSHNVFNVRSVPN